MRVFIVVLLFLTCAATAQGFAPRPSDQVLDQQGMNARVMGRTHEFFDGGVSFFSVTGIYTYTYADGGRAYGTYSLPNEGADGVVCSEFDNGFSRCDMYIDDGVRLVLITDDGVRFPVREVR